jgi:uncharacterized protein (TIGR02757 family)
MIKKVSYPQTSKQISKILDEAVFKFNNSEFIKSDPISIPHMFINKQDIEIAGLFAAIFAWGQRTTIINKCKELLERMNNEPYQFVINHTVNDIKQLNGFKHRTFNDTDLLYFIDFLHRWYHENESLETAFSKGMKRKDQTTEHALNHFQKIFFDSEYAPARTRKHVASPTQHSACKRLNMYLRWMVRKDNCGVDFGLWNEIKPNQLVCPLDVHVDRTARSLGLLHRKQVDWLAAIELTENLRKFDVKDPIKYDFALFGLSMNNGL